MLFTYAQIVGLAMFVAGLFMLTGLAWTMVLVGLLVTSIAVAFEVKIKEVKPNDAG